MLVSAELSLRFVKFRVVGRGYVRFVNRIGRRGCGLKSLIPRRCQIFIMAILFCTLGSASARSTLYDFKMVQQENVMLHFDLDATGIVPKLFSLAGPHRLVIDLPDTRLDTRLPSETFSQGAVRSIRYAQHGEGFLRVVLDLRRAVTPTYSLVPRQGGERLIVDLGVKGSPAFTNSAPQIQQPVVLRDAVVVIDAGHGGKDPGAIGQRETLEKDITLAVAKKLYAVLKARPGVRPVLVRDDDVYVKLRERMGIARQEGADLFVSIHADAIERNEAKGSSVYTLSLDGATSEAAAFLAKRENEAAALYGDVELDGMDDILRQTLLNLAQSSTLERSMEAGADILVELRQIGNVHKQAVEQAEFAVLKSPDVPSVLIETAFISNRQEEKKLNSADYQQALAEAIERGITRFLMRRAPEGTHLAAQRRLRSAATE